MKTVSGKDMARILERHGWRRIRTRSAHFTYENDGVSITVPVHGNRDLKKGLQHAIMKAAGLTEADL